MAASIGGSLPASSPPTQEETGTATQMVVNDYVRLILSFGTHPVPPHSGKLARFFDPTIPFPDHARVFQQAHPKVVELTGLIAFSQTSKYYHELLQPDINRLRKEITLLFTTMIHEIPRCARGLRETVNAGYCLTTHKIHVLENPDAIWNQATTDRNEGSRQTLLHNAVAPHYSGTQSISFVRFLLEVIKNNGMSAALLSHKDDHGKTPLQAFQKHMGWIAIKRTPEEALRHFESEMKSEPAGASYYAEKIDELRRAQAVQKILVEHEGEVAKHHAKRRELLNKSFPAVLSQLVESYLVYPNPAPAAAAPSPVPVAHGSVVE